jgi:tetratricopeptide (TPR) repeat protein
MVRSKTKPKTSRVAPSIPTEPVVQIIIDEDYLDDPPVERPPLKPTWARLRLAFLLAILIPLAIFGFFHNRRTTAQSRIGRALSNWDHIQALREIKSMEKFTGLTDETAFLRSRVYRHMGDDIAFAQFCDLASQLGAPREKIEHERTLRDLQLGEIEELDRKLAELMAGTHAEMHEIGPAVAYGLLTRNDFASLQQFLVFWRTQDKDSVWLPFFRGIVQVLNNDVRGGITSLEECLGDHPNFVPAYLQLGSAYVKAQENENAIAPLEKYLSSNSEDMNAIGVLASALANLDRGDQVIAMLDPIVESGNASIGMKMILARVYAQREKWTDVVNVLSPVAAIWPEDVLTANYLSQAHQALGNEADADRFAKVAASGQPDLQSVDGRLARIFGGADQTAEKHYELGHILMHKQSREDGLQWLSSALNLDETYLPAHEDLVVYFTQTNQPELAARHQRYINLRRGTQ